MWPFWPKQCGRFDQSSVAVLVVIQLSVAVLVVAILECGRFDWFPPKVPNRYTVGELCSGVTGFATIYVTGSHRFMPCMLQVRNDEIFVSPCFDISQQDELCGEHMENTDDL